MRNFSNVDYSTNIKKFAQNKKAVESESFDTPCPKIVLTSVEGNDYDLKDFVGNVIIIKFSKFYKRDLPNLVYLEHLAKKYCDEDVSLLFINTLGKHHSDQINKICRFNSPIIEDNGEISGLFNATSEDIIIIDRKFKIKFKYAASPIFNKSLIFDEVMRWAFPGMNHFESDVSMNELDSILNQLKYFDVFKEKNIPIDTYGKKTIITLFTSMCLGCDESIRIQILKEVSKHHDMKKSQIIILFGFGNNIAAVKEFAKINNWNEFAFHIGVIMEPNNNKVKDYYKLFSLRIDPRTFIFNSKGELVFAEDFYSSRFIDSRLLLKTK